MRRGMRYAGVSMAVRRLAVSFLLVGLGSTAFVIGEGACSSFQEEVSPEGGPGPGDGGVPPGEGE